jgi:hypothetical protein
MASDQLGFSLPRVEEGCPYERPFLFNVIAKKEGPLCCGVTAVPLTPSVSAGTRTTRQVILAGVLECREPISIQKRPKKRGSRHKRLFMHVGLSATAL